MPNQIFLISCVFGIVLIFSFLTYSSYKQFQVIKRRKNFSFKTLTKDFKRKIVMTFGLGTIFFGFYGCLVIFLAYWLKHEKKSLDLFFFAYQHPLIFFYQGLFIFVIFSLFIYLVRLIIKYIYLSYFKE